MKQPTDRQLYETECKDHAFTQKILKRVIAERGEMRAWIMQAAPMLSTAACIVIDESIERLGEIEGVRGVLELCPVEFHIANAIAMASADEKTPPKETTL